MDALGHGNNAITLFSIDPLDIVNKVLHIEVGFRQINQVRACTVNPGQSGGGSQPAGMASHDLHHNDHAGIIHMRILIHLHH